MTSTKLSVGQKVRAWWFAPSWGDVEVVGFVGRTWVKVRDAAGQEQLLQRISLKPRMVAPTLA